MLPYRQAIGDPKQVMENRQVHETLESCVTTLRHLAFEVKTLARWNFSFSIYLFIFHARRRVAQTFQFAVVSKPSFYNQITSPKHSPFQHESVSLNVFRHMKGHLKEIQKHICRHPKCSLQKS